MPLRGATGPERREGSLRLRLEPEGAPDGTGTGSTVGMIEAHRYTGTHTCLPSESRQTKYKEGFRP